MELAVLEGRELPLKEVVKLKNHDRDAMERNDSREESWADGVGHGGQTVFHGTPNVECGLRFSHRGCGRSNG